jgi:hypothetical protein
MSDKFENVQPFGDFLNNYLNEANIQCFEKCVKDFTKDTLQKVEVSCMNSCFEKYFISYANISEILELKNTNIKY